MIIKSVEVCPRVGKNLEIMESNLCDKIKTI